MSASPIDTEVPVPAAEALRRLKEGNARFVAGKADVARHVLESAVELFGAQRPFAALLGCSDSRVPPELIFDASFGDLFVMRVAGNVVSSGVAGSMQYAGAHLGVRLLVVLGHEGCGAVKAALETRHEGVLQRSRIQHLVDLILPALETSDPTLPPAAQVSQAVESNVRWTVRAVAESPEGRAKLVDGRMTIVGAIYEMETGRARFLD